jgi:ribonuclease HI
VLLRDVITLCVCVKCVTRTHQADLKDLQAAKTTALLVQQSHKELNDIATRHSVGLFDVLGHPGERGNEIADKLASLLDLTWPWGSLA